MGDGLTVLQFHGFVCQQAQAPFGMSLGSRTAGQGSDQSSLSAINAGWTTRLWLIVKALQSTLLILFNEGSYCRIGQSRHPAHFFDGLTFMQLQQGDDPLEDLTFQITLM